MNNYSITEMSKIAEISQHTLRYYEKIGLLKDIKRDGNGRRSYGENDINLINFINCLRSTGMPIKQIKSYLDFLSIGDTTIDKRKKILKNHLEYIKKEIKNFEACSKVLEYKLKNYKKIESEL